MSSDGTWHHSNKYFTRELDELYGHSYDVDAPYGTTTSNIWTSLAEAITKMEELADTMDDRQGVSLPIEAPPEDTSTQPQPQPSIPHRLPNEPRTTIEKLRGVESAFYDKPSSHITKHEEDNARQQLFIFMDNLVSRLNRHKNTQPFSFINYELEDYEINLRDVLNTLLYSQLPKKFPAIKVRSFDYTADKEAGLLVILVETNLGDASIALVATNNQNSWKILNYSFTPTVEQPQPQDEPVESAVQPSATPSLSPTVPEPEPESSKGLPKHEEEDYEIIVFPYTFVFHVVKDGDAVRANMNVSGPDIDDDSVVVFESNPESMFDDIKEKSKYYQNLDLKSIMNDLRNSYFQKAIESYLVSQLPRVAKRGEMNNDTTR